MEDRGRVRLVTLDRQGSLNAFNRELYSLAAGALGEASVSDDVAVVVLTGSGRAFSVGQDLAEMSELGAARADESGERTGEYAFGPFMDALTGFDKPLVAAVNGLAVGLGVTLLGYCDLVVISEDARFRVPFVSLGVAPEAGSSFTLPETMGRQRASHFLFTAGWLDATGAVESGLAWKAVPAGMLLDEALGVAAQIASMPVSSLVETKRLLQATRLGAATAARRREEEAFSRLVGSPANREALAAFLERRDPDFSNLPKE